MKYKNDLQVWYESIVCETTWFCNFYHKTIVILAISFSLPLTQREVWGHFHNVSKSQSFSLLPRSSSTRPSFSYARRSFIQCPKRRPWSWSLTYEMYGQKSPVESITLALLFNGKYRTCFNSWILVEITLRLETKPFQILTHFDTIKQNHYFWKTHKIISNHSKTKVFWH